MSSKTTHSLSYAHSPLSAGPGAFASSDFDELDTNMLLSNGQPSNCFVYPVTGDSCDPDIPHGSLVVVNRTIEPMDGHTVAVSLDGLNHIKVLERTTLRLVSPNTDYEPIQLREPFNVIGVVTWCIQPITRTIRREGTEPVYSLKGFASEGEGFRAKFDRSDGQKLELKIDSQSMKNGIKWATKLLSDKVLHWRS